MSSGIYWEGRCTWQRGMPAERDAARICVWLVTLMLLTNGFWDTACAACIFSGTCGWLSTIHLDILLAGGIPTDALITRVVGFWIITNGCIRLLAGACPDTGGETGAFATYVIEGRFEDTGWPSPASSARRGWGCAPGCAAWRGVFSRWTSIHPDARRVYLQMKRIAVNVRSHARNFRWRVDWHLREFVSGKCVDRYLRQPDPFGVGLG